MRPQIRTARNGEDRGPHYNRRMANAGDTNWKPAWTVEDVRGFLLAYGREPRRLEVEQLKSWWFNLVLRVDADGEGLVLRRYGVTPPEEVRWELAVLAHLREHDFPTFTPLLRADALGERLGGFFGRPAILYPYVEGQDGRNLDWSVALAQTAQAVARIHELTEGLAIAYPRVQSGTESRRLVRQLIEAVRARGVAAHESALGDLLGRSEGALGDFEARLASYPEGLRRGVVHHDAHAHNVLFRDNQLVALIDFDDAHAGYLVADPAVMICNWADDGEPGDPLNLEKAVRVVREYERHRRLTDAECELLPDFVLMYLLCNASEEIRIGLAQGADGNAAVNDCNLYRTYLHHVEDIEWLVAFRKALRSGSS